MESHKMPNLNHRSARQGKKKGMRSRRKENKNEQRQQLENSYVYDIY